MRPVAEPARARLGRKAAAAPGLILFLIALALLFQVSSLWLPTRDGAAYLSIARSMVSGEGILRFGSPQLHFLPGYPALIAPAFLISDQPFLWISLLHWLLSVAFLAGCYAWFRRHAPEHALLLTALSVLNVSVLYYFRRTLSEAAFMPLLIWTAVLMDRMLEKSPSSASGFQLVLTTAATAYLCAIRMAGVALACGFACALLAAVRGGDLSLRRAAALASCVVLAPLAVALSLVYYDHAVADLGERGATYYRELTRHAVPLHEQILNGARLRLQEVGRVLLPGAFKAYGGWLNPIMLLYLPAAAAVAVGWRQLLRRQPSALLVACPFYVGLYIVWPHDQGTRFMTPLVPVLWAAIAATVSRSRWRAPIMRLSPWLVLACLATSAVYCIADRIEARRLARYAEMTEKMAAVVPMRARIGFIHASADHSANAFANFCAVRFDRRCEEIAGASEVVAPHIEYLAILGAPRLLVGFAPVQQQKEWTVLRRER